MATQTHKTWRRFITLTPFTAMLGMVGVHCVHSFIIVFKGYEVSDGYIFIFDYGFALLVAWWVEKDKHFIKKEAPYEYLAFIFFAWILVFPWYLIKTRSWRGVWMSIGFIFLYETPYLMEWAGYYAQDFNL